MSRKTRTRLEGFRGLTTTAARKIPAVDTVLTAKEVYDSTYKIVKGKQPRSISLRDLPPWIVRFERDSARRERQLDRRFR